MKALSKIETSFNRILNIRYDNEHGGAYAYLQFMAYSRDLLSALRPLKSAERQIEAIEGINWLFNETLSGSFSHSQKAMFETKMMEVKEIFNSIKVIVSESKIYAGEKDLSFHAQAA